MMQSKVAVGVPEHRHVLCSVTVELIQLGPVNAPYFSTHQRFRHDSLWARAQQLWILNTQNVDFFEKYPKNRDFFDLSIYIRSKNQILAQKCPHLHHGSIS